MKVIIDECVPRSSHPSRSDNMNLAVGLNPRKRDQNRSASRQRRLNNRRRKYSIVANATTIPIKPPTVDLNPRLNSMHRYRGERLPTSNQVPVVKDLLPQIDQALAEIGTNDFVEI